MAETWPLHYDLTYLMTRLRRYSVKPFTAVAAVVFGIVAVAQLLRFVMGWDVSIDGFHVPVWASAVATIVAGGLAAMLWVENHG